MGVQGAKILHFSVSAHSLLAFQPQAIAKDSPDGPEFAWTSGLKLLIVIFFLIFFLLYVLVLINGERQAAAPRERQEGQPTSRMADSEPQPRHHARSGGPAGSATDKGPTPAGEPSKPG